MTETCCHCHRASSLLRRRSHNVGTWCGGCANWCQPGEWIAHLTLERRGIVVETIPVAPNDPVPAAQTSLFI
jgi:hypothetical protein